MSREKRSRRNEGQALVEMIVVMPVLLLLLLAAANIGKLFVISGKSEISARYVALSHFREAPFGDAYPAYTARQEIERLFFDDALDDSGLPDGMSSEADDPDVTYEELGNLDYVPDDHGDPLLIWLWAWVNATNQLFPVRGARSTFTYDLPFFPEGELSGSGLDASYDAVGNFVMLAESFSGAEGEQLRLALEAAHLIVGAEISAGAAVGILVGLWLIYLP